MILKRLKILFFIFIMSLFLYNCGSDVNKIFEDVNTGAVSGIVALNISENISSNSISYSVLSGNNTKISKNNEYIADKYKAFNNQNIIKLENAEVIAVNFYGDTFGPIYSDENGFFKLTGLPLDQNKYIIKAMKNNIKLITLSPVLQPFTTLDIGTIDIVSTSIVVLMQNIIKKEFDEVVRIGESTSYTADIIARLLTVDFNNKLKELRDSIKLNMPGNKNYILYAVIRKILLDTYNDVNVFTIEEFFSNPNLTVNITFNDNSVSNINNEIINNITEIVEYGSAIITW